LLMALQGRDRRTTPPAQQAVHADTTDDPQTPTRRRVRDVEPEHTSPSRRSTRRTRTRSVVARNN
jgi:hypothetical protein